VPGRVCTVVPASGSRATWHRGLSITPQNAGHRRSRDDRSALRRSDHPPAGRRRRNGDGSSLLALVIATAYVAVALTG
jgi:hypothetical protein